MLRAFWWGGVAGALAAALSCGGNVFSTESGASDDGGGGSGGRDGSMPLDTGAGGDGPSSDGVTPADAITPVDATGEPPPSCTGDFACVTAVPAGWDGPLEVYSGAGAPPTCTTGYAQSVTAFDTLQAPSAMCTCACGASQTTCTSPTLVFYNGATCTSAPVQCGSAVILTPDVCTTIDEQQQCATATYLDMSVLGGAWSAGACAPQPSSQVPPYSWSDQMSACASTVAPARVDCQPGQICAPKPGAGFGSRVCISHAGDVPCPGGGYGVKRTFFTGVDDTRGCTACSCGKPNGGSCSFSIQSYQSSSTSCLGMGNTYMPGDQCAGVNQPGDFRLTQTAVAGSCAPNPSVPSGSATPSGPVTVCCPL